MRIVRSLLFILSLFYSIFFCIENSQDIKISIPFLGEFQFPAFLVVILFTSIGIFLGYFLSTIGIFKSYRSRKVVEKQNRELKKRLEVFEVSEKLEKDTNYNNIPSKLHSGIIENQIKY